MDKFNNNMDKFNNKLLLDSIKKEVPVIISLIRDKYHTYSGEYIEDYYYSDDDYDLEYMNNQYEEYMNYEYDRDSYCNLSANLWGIGHGGEYWSSDI